MNVRYRSWCTAMLSAILLPLAVAAQSTAAVREEFHFDVSLDRRPIGTHRFLVTRASDGQASIESMARFDVRILGIPAYRYRHRATEHWQGDCLAAIDAATDDNGRPLRVEGSQQRGRFLLQQPAPMALPGCVSAYAYWNRDLLLRQRELLNPQTGRLDALRVETIGAETLDLNGRRMSASRYRLHAAGNAIDLWYSERGDWLRLESSAGSRRLIYVLRPASRNP
jgi:hypothetical protein